MGAPGSDSSSPRRRDQDGYGGSLRNRMRFAIDVLENIREKVGPSVVVGTRIPGGEGMKGGLPHEERRHRTDFEPDRRSMSEGDRQTGGPAAPIMGPIALVTGAGALVITAPSCSLPAKAGSSTWRSTLPV